MLHPTHRDLAACLPLLALSPTLLAQDAATQREWPEFLRPDARYGRGALRGTYQVWEDRAKRRGRKIDLHIVVLPATGNQRQPDPVFFVAGGPGQAATTIARHMERSWMRIRRDMVFVDQRGTGRSNPLHVRLQGSDDNLQGYLAPIFDVATFERARRRLEKIADLTKYTTPIAMDDLDEVRRVLGFEQINLVGGSYGSRASLVYIRRHPGSVRTATLTGLAPIEFKNPLYHASAAQAGIDALIAECETDPRYRIYRNLRRELDAVLARLRQKPARVTVRHPATGAAAEVILNRDAFAEALRVLMYTNRTNRMVPLLIHRAHGGDYTAFAEHGIRSNRGLRNMLAFGMLMSVVGSEDISRIEADEIESATKGTFLGDGRVRSQMAVARIWPRGEVPADYGEPVRGDMPVLFISGSLDPVTPPRFGAAAARHFPNGLHVVVPEAHGTSDSRVEQLKQQFLAAGTTAGLVTAFVAKARPAPLAQPKRRVVR